MMTYGLFTGGFGLHYGAEKVGMLVIPASSGNTKRQLKLMKDFETTVVHATPLLRYRTRDLSSVNDAPCKCGRTHRRIARIEGRTDDMLIINGVIIYPSQIEEAIMKLLEMGTNYQIVVERAGALDRPIVRTEVNAEIFSDDTRDINLLRERVMDNLRSFITISPVVEFHEPGVLPVKEGKAQRVFDNRKEE